MLAQLHPPALQLLPGHPAVQAAGLAPDTPGPHLLHLRDQRFRSPSMILRITSFYDRKKMCIFANANRKFVMIHGLFKSL